MRKELDGIKSEYHAEYDGNIKNKASVKDMQSSIDEYKSIVDLNKTLESDIKILNSKLEDERNKNENL